MSASVEAENTLRQAEKFFSNGRMAAGSLHLLLAGSTGPDPAIQAGYEALYSRHTLALRRYSTLLDTLRSSALEARLQAYAPYSGFAVGAALLAGDGTIWKGCNVESSSYGLTICAERTALVSAIAGGKREFHAVVVATDAASPTPPCGACRQMLYEFAPEAVVLMITSRGGAEWMSLSGLLPHAFCAHTLADK